MNPAFVQQWHDSLQAYPRTAWAPGYPTVLEFNVFLMGGEL